MAQFSSVTRACVRISAPIVRPSGPTAAWPEMTTILPGVTSSTGE
jgi:hypothetical protein